MSFGRGMLRRWGEIWPSIAESGGNGRPKSPFTPSTVRSSVGWDDAITGKKRCKTTEEHPSVVLHRCGVRLGGSIVVLPGDGRRGKPTPPLQISKSGAEGGGNRAREKVPNSRRYSPRGLEIVWGDVGARSPLHPSGDGLLDPRFFKVQTLVLCKVLATEGRWKAGIRWIVGTSGSWSWSRSEDLPQTNPQSNNRGASPKGSGISRDPSPFP